MVDEWHSSLTGGSLVREGPGLDDGPRLPALTSRDKAQHQQREPAAICRQPSTASCRLLGTCNRRSQYEPEPEKVVFAKARAADFLESNRLVQRDGGLLLRSGFEDH
jgi:hypothetical protein